MSWLQYKVCADQSNNFLKNEHRVYYTWSILNCETPLTLVAYPTSIKTMKMLVATHQIINLLVIA